MMFLLIFIVMAVPSRNVKKCESIINTRTQLRICQCILKITEIKQKWCGIIYRTEITSLLKIKFQTLESYLNKLKKKGIIKTVPHVTNPNWGGVFMLTLKGKEKIETELQSLLSFKDVDEALKKVQPLLC